jgi:GWxTD domain-containing protein
MIGNYTGSARFSGRKAYAGGVKSGTRVALAALLFGLGALAPKASTPPKKNAPAADPRAAALIAALPDEDRRWLTEFVAPIILPEERKAYLELTETYQRDDFREQFWQRRELPELPWILGPGYRYRYRELRELADSRYDGWRSDAGRLVIRFGEPAEIIVPRCAGEEDFRVGVEVWKYVNPPLGLNRRHFLFFRPQGLGPRRLWTLLDPDGPALFYPNSCRQKLDDLKWDCVPKPPPGDTCSMCGGRCDVYVAYGETKVREVNGMGALGEKGRLLGAPDVSLEDLARQPDKWATTSRRGAKPIDVNGKSQDAAAAPVALTPPPEPLRRLSGAELAERMNSLERHYREWLDLALPLLTEEELSAFVQMSNADRDAFMAEFWKRKKGPPARHPAGAPAPERTPAAPLTTPKPPRI